MRFTCPYCHSAARLTPNPAHDRRADAPRYVLACSGCSRTVVARAPTPPLGSDRVRPRSDRSESRATSVSAPSRAARLSGATAVGTPPGGRFAAPARQPQGRANLTRG